MEITLTRYKFANTYTEGRMSFDTTSDILPTIEDVVREDGTKVYAQTAIPYGRYKVVLDVLSPKFSRYQFYMDTCKGKLPRLLNVPKFDGILLHCGINEDNSSGCIILNHRNHPLDESKDYFKTLINILNKAPDKDDIYINIIKG